MDAIIDKYNPRMFSPNEKELIQSMSERALLSVFRVLRCNELGRYYPFFEERDGELRYLNNECREPMSGEFAMWYFMHAEGRAARHDDILNGENIPTDSLELLREISDKLEHTPIMAEVPEKLAFELWLKCGTWSGVLAAAGLSLLEYDTIDQIRHRFGIDNVSVELVRGKYRQRMMETENGVEAIEKVCSYVRETGKRPVKAEFLSDVRPVFFKIFGGLNQGMEQLGLLPRNTPPAVNKKLINPLQKKLNVERTRKKSSSRISKREFLKIKYDRQDKAFFYKHILIARNQTKGRQYELINPYNIAFSIEARELYEERLFKHYDKQWKKPPQLASFDYCRNHVLDYYNMFVFPIGYDIENAGIEELETSNAMALGALGDFFKRIRPYVSSYFSDYLLLTSAFDEHLNVHSIGECGLDAEALAGYTNLRYVNNASRVTYLGVLLFNEL